MEEHVAVSGDGELLLGRLLPRNGLITEKQLDTALKGQEESSKLGLDRPIGEICVEGGWCSARDLAIVLGQQRREIDRATSLGELMLTQGWATPDQLNEALDEQEEIGAPLGEILVEKGFASEATVLLALHLQKLSRGLVARRVVVSEHSPLNVMEVVVGEMVDDAIAQTSGCFCSRCRADVCALALNELDARYVNDHAGAGPMGLRIRAEEGDRVSKILEQSVEKVKRQPKASCRFKQAGKRVGSDEVVLLPVPVRVVFRHVHLSAEHIKALFGDDAELTVWRALRQPGVFAAREVVRLVGPRGSIERVRVLGSLWDETQVEVSGSDQFALGMSIPIREGGHLKGTPGITLEGPAGSVDLTQGVIRQQRHLHISGELAKRLMLRSRDFVRVRIFGERPIGCDDILVRVSKDAIAEVHLDADEGAAARIPVEARGHVLASSR